MKTHILLHNKRDKCAVLVPIATPLFEREDGAAFTTVDGCPSIVFTEPFADILAALSGQVITLPVKPNMSTT